MKLERLRNLREDADLSQDKIAKILGISQRVYAYYENGEHTIPIDVLIRIADYYQVSLDYLCQRTDNPNVN